MAKQPKTEAFFKRDKHTFEVTSGQLVFTICTLIVVALVCFSLGILLGNTQSARHRNQVAANIDGSASQVPTPTGVGTQMTPRNDLTGTTQPAAPASPTGFEPVLLDAPQTPGAIGSSALSEETTTTLKQDPPEKEIPQPVTEQPDGAEATVTVVDASPSAEPAPPKKAEEHVTIAAVQDPPPTPAKAKEIPKTLERPATEPPAAKKAPPPTPTSQSTGRYAIQVAAFTAKNRKLAEDFVRAMRTESNYQARIVRSHDGKYYRVLVGEYRDRQAADAARAAIAKKPELSDCWVKTLD